VSNEINSCAGFVLTINEFTESNIWKKESGYKRHNLVRSDMCNCSYKDSGPKKMA
jgi:hypothetical protein